MTPPSPRAFVPPLGALRWSPRFDDSAARGWLALFCVAQVLLWSVAFAATYSAPEIDSAEQFVWSFSLESGYWKHPPLPSWLMHALLEVFGPSVVLPFVATQGCVVIALALVWRLGCEWLSPSRALVAVVLTSLVSYHNVGADTFNHNTALLPFQAAVFLAFHRATRRANLAWWTLAGACAGLALLVKYVALLPVLGLVAYFCVDRTLHTRRQLVGLACAVAALALVVLPHAIWLEETRYLPFRYARAVAEPLPGLGATVWHLADFVGIQLLRITPFLGAALFVFWPRAAAAMPAPAAAWDTGGAAAPRPGNDRLFLWFAALSPLAGTLVLSLATHTALQSRWGANAFLLAGLFLVTLARRPTDEAMVRRTLHAVLVVQVVLCLAMTLGKTVVAERLGVRTRANFPSAALAERAFSTWSGEVPDAPLRLVVSDIWLGGNIVAQSAGSASRVAVLIDGHHLKSPWVKPDAVLACGALVLDDLTPDRAGHANPNAALDALMARADVTGTWSLPWARPELHPPSDARGRVRWGVIRPRGERPCLLR